MARAGSQIALAAQSLARPAVEGPKHPDLRVAVATTWLDPASGLRMLVHLPADAETEARMRVLSDAVGVRAKSN